MFVFSNLATSLDGKIATSTREYFPIGTPADRDEMQRLRRKCDAVLMGSASLRAFKRFCGLREPSRRQPANVVLSRTLEGISPRWPFFQREGVRRILVVSGRIPPARERAFARSCEIVRIRGGASSARQVVAALSKLGIERLLVEGGGAVMWDFAKHDLIDEYHVTITPRILGGTEAPTLVDGEGFAAHRSLKLKLLRARRVVDELFLTYAKTGARGA